MKKRITRLIVAAFVAIIMSGISACKNSETKKTDDFADLIEMPLSIRSTGILLPDILFCRAVKIRGRLICRKQRTATSIIPSKNTNPC